MTDHTSVVNYTPTVMTIIINKPNPGNSGKTLRPKIKVKKQNTENNIKNYRNNFVLNV